MTHVNFLLHRLLVSETQTDRQDKVVIYIYIHLYVYIYGYMLTVKEVSANIDFLLFHFFKSKCPNFFSGKIEDHSHHNWMRIPKL